MITFNHLQQALAQYGEAIADRYKTNLEASGRRATGNLISSVNTKVTVDEQTFVIELSLEDYYYYVENGRSAGRFPPVDKILEWIRVKPILPTPDINGKLPTEKQLAFLIGRKIANEGFEGTKDLEHTMEEVDYEAIIEEALDQDVLGCLDELLVMLT
jgi:hypothetical protein